MKKPEHKALTAEEIILIFENNDATEVECQECFGRGWLAQGRVTHTCGACNGLGVVPVYKSGTY